MAKILLVDDHDDNLYIASLVLRRDHHEIITANTGQEALEKAVTEAPDVILLDIQMPEINGFEVCKQLKQQKATATIPVVFLTAKFKDSDSLIKGLEIGGEDYITKPFSTPELRARVNVMVRLKNQWDELELKNQELVKLNQVLKNKNDELVKTQWALEELATTDSLTKLKNRRYFIERMNEEFSRAKRMPQPISFIMLDIDFFKKVNDTYGHLCGDSVLQQFAKILKQNTRRHDIVARYGGEEFIIGMIGQNEEAADVTAERIRRDVEEAQFQHETTALKLTCSAGVGTFTATPKEPLSLDTFISDVDHALYQAKEKGRNQVITINDLKTNELSS